MSKRHDFIAIADALRSARNGLTSHDTGVDDAAQSIAHAFEVRSQSFDRDRFLTNAGVPRRTADGIPYCQAISHGDVFELAEAHRRVSMPTGDESVARVLASRVSPYDPVAVAKMRDKP